jgi:hypothetical protein
MAVDITLNDAQISFHEGDLSLSQSVGNRGGGNFAVRGSEGTVSAGQKFGAFNQGHRIFGGMVDRVDITRVGRITEEPWYVANVTSWEQRLDMRQIKSAFYSGLQLGPMIQQIIDDWAPDEGITNDHLDVGPLTASEVGTMHFKNVSVLEAILEIAGRVGYVFYLDPDLHSWFHSKDLTTSTGLHFTTALQNYHAPTITEDRSQYCNRITIAGKFDIFPITEAALTPDGTIQIFTLQDGGIDSPAELVVKITVDSVEQVIGIKDVDVDADWWWTPGSATIEQNPALPPLTTEELKVFYHKIGANQITVEETADITARAAIEIGSGIYHHAFNDDSATSVDQLTQKANAYLDRHCPSRNGAAAGSLPKSYKFSFYSWVNNINSLKVGAILTLDWEGIPTTGGPIKVIVQDINWEHFMVEKESWGDAYVCTVTCVEYVEVGDSVEFLKTLMEGGTITGGGAVTSFGGGGGGGAGANYLIDKTLTDGELNVDSPVAMPSPGSFLAVILKQDATGGRIPVFDATFEHVNYKIRTLANTITSMLFVARSNSKWFRIGVPATGENIGL